MTTEIHEEKKSFDTIWHPLMGGEGSTQTENRKKNFSF